MPAIRCRLEGCDRLCEHGGRSVCQTHRKRMAALGTYEPAPKREKRQKPDPLPRPCRQCGGPLPARHRLCSPECQAARTRANELRNRPRRPRGTRICADCGIEFETTGAKSATAPPSARTETHIAAVERSRWEPTSSTSRRSKVYERDGYSCQLCGRPVKMAATVPHPKAPTLDHIIPLAAGGTHEYANVQLAHFICNSRKSAGGGQLRLVRSWPNAAPEPSPKATPPSASRPPAPARGRRGPRRAGTYRAIRFIETYCRSPKGEGHGQPLQASPRSRRSSCAGRSRPGMDIGILATPRGNGKSSLGGALAVWALFDDDATGAPQVPVVATTIGQGIRSCYGVAVSHDQGRAGAPAPLADLHRASRRPA